MYFILKNYYLQLHYGKVELKMQTKYLLNSINIRSITHCQQIASDSVNADLHLLPTVNSELGDFNNVLLAEELSC